MAKISQKRIADYFLQANNANTTAGKGRALEDLMCYVFSKVPGVTRVSRNQLNAFQTEEIDIAIWNDQKSNGLYFLPNILLIECKNWSNAVGSQEVSYFAGRLRQRGCDHGILVAANGVTGNANERSAAHFELATALRDGIRIMVVTRQDLEALICTSELARLLQERLCDLVVCGTAA